MNPARLVAVVGLRREAALLPPGVAVICAGADARRAATLLVARGAAGLGGVLSFGIAGGLDPALGAGQLVAAAEVRGANGQSWPADPAWTAALVGAGARSGILAGAAGAACDAAAKRALRAATGALAVDLESAPAAAFAAAHRLPFAALRAIADTAGEDIPPAALLGVRPDGSADAAAVLRALARRPSDLPSLLRLAARSHTALAALARALALLGRDLGRL